MEITEENFPFFAGEATTIFNLRLRSVFKKDVKFLSKEKSEIRIPRPSFFGFDDMEQNRKNEGLGLVEN